MLSIILYNIYNKKYIIYYLIKKDDIMSLEEDIQNWLLEEGMLREKKDDESADFHFIIEFPKDNILDVVQPKGKDCIVIGCATQVAPQHLELMSSASDKTKREFILNTQIDINKFLVDFELSINQDLLQQYIITETIFIDGLSKNEFINSIKRVFKAKIHCVWLIEKTFGSISPQSSPSNENSMFV